MSADLVGTWELVSFETRLSSGDVRYPLGPQPLGRIIYDAQGNMAVTVCSAERESLKSPDKIRATAAEKVTAFDSFDAYFGTYTVDTEREIVTHHLDGALFPNWSGTDQERRYSFNGKQLELSTAPIAYGGDTAVAVLVWERG